MLLIHHFYLFVFEIDSLELIYSLHLFRQHLVLWNHIILWKSLHQLIVSPLFIQYLVVAGKFLLIENRNKATFTIKILIVVMLHLTHRYQVHHFIHLKHLFQLLIQWVLKLISVHIHKVKHFVCRYFIIGRYE